MKWRSCCFLVLAGSGMLSMLGCGGSDAPDTASISGTVMYQSKPLAGANVALLVKDAPLAQAQTDSEGKFTISAAPLGNAQVSVSKMETPESGPVGGSTLPTPEDMRNMQMQQMQGKNAQNSKPKSAIPEKYSDPKTSGLTAEITSDPAKNVFKFELN